MLDLSRNGSCFTACLPRLLEVWIEAQRPKAQFQTLGFSSCVFWWFGVVTTTLGVSISSNTVYVVSSLWNVFAWTCDLQIPSGSKRWLLSIPQTHPWLMVQWTNTLSLNEVLHAPSRGLTQLQDHSDEVLPLWWKVAFVKMGSRGGFGRWQECYSILGFGGSILLTKRMVFKSLSAKLSWYHQSQF